MRERTSRALELAVRAHLHQLDSDGESHLLHVLRVAFAVPDGDARVVALLHDVVEDSSTTLSDLRVAGFPERIVEAVDALTRRFNDEEGSEPYSELIRRAAKNPIARAVKIADATDNLDRSRAQKKPALVTRYEKVLRELRREAE